MSDLTQPQSEGRRALTLHPVDPRESALTRLAHFRRIALKVATDLEADLAEWFGFRAGEARLVAVLYSARGPVRREHLMRLADVETNTLRHYLASIRAALGDGAIPPCTEDGTYQLTQLGRAACDEAIQGVGMERLRKELAA